MDDQQILTSFETARHDSSLAILEGFHAIKHAIRFGAEIDLVVSSNLPELARLAESLAPDVGERVESLAIDVPPALFEQLAPHPHRTEVIAVAHRPATDLDLILADSQPRPVVFLERPSHLGNMGAVIRVAAGAGAAGVVTSGEHDPWNPVAIRGAAGLHYALPVTQVGELPDCDRPLLAIHPDGEELSSGSIPDRAILAFGEEREGLSDDLLHRAETCLRIPMTDGVSSLNLATAVAVTLYTWRLTRL
ncbi:TrmH family RNA methyltransferase [Gemmatimonadota bacterium]